MNKRTITIAGLNCDGGMDYAQKLVGKMVYAMPEPTNKVDSEAVEIVDTHTHHIAYVVRDDKKFVRLCMQTLNDNQLDLRIISFSAKAKILTAEVVEDVEIDESLLDDKKEYDEWQYSGPVLPESKDMRNLNGLMRSATRLLSNFNPNDEVKVNDLNEVLSEMYDLFMVELSKEANDIRRSLVHMLEKIKCSALEKAIIDVKCAGCRKAKHVAEQEKRFKEWINSLAIDNKDLLTSNDPCLIDKVEAELHNFPNKLYSTFINDVPYFLSRLQYAEIPRAVLCKFISGIAFVRLPKIKSGIVEDNNHPIDIPYKPLSQEELSDIVAEEISSKDPLMSDEAKLIWKKAIKNRWVDKQYKPSLSKYRAAVLAFVISEKLHLNPKWPFFEKLWGIKDLSTLYSRAMECQYYPALFKEISNTLNLK